jgi:hypothetical protein
VGFGDSLKDEPKSRQLRNCWWLLEHVAV